LNKTLYTGLLFFLAFTAVVFSSYTLFKKDWTLIRSIKTSTIRKVSIDRHNSFFIVDDKGNLFKYDSLGNLALTFSPQKKADIALIEAWRTVNIFIFYRDLQEYNILDRFLTTSNSNFKFEKETEIDEKTVGFARLATIASDNNLWVFDDQDFSLKKYDTRRNKVSLHTSLDLILDPSLYDLTYMREYQNLLFINDKNSGILIFDNLGNYKTKIPVKDLNYFNFFENNIYFVLNGQLIVQDIYTSAQKIIDLPEGKIFNYVLLTNNKGYFFTSDSVDIYGYKK
jgi:hypothetical protein